MRFHISCKISFFFSSKMLNFCGSVVRKERKLMQKAVVVFHLYSSAQNLEACAGVCCREGICIGNVMSAPQHSDMNGNRLLYISNQPQSAWISVSVFGYKFREMDQQLRCLSIYCAHFRRHISTNICPIVITVVQCTAREY